MNYTSKHHLPQWVSSDRVRMADFNSAMANIESGMNANASAAAAAQSTANTAKSAANSAQAAASTAQTTANAAQSTANAAYSPDNKPYVTGSYTGQAKNQNIVLGFMPSFLIVSGMQSSYSTGDTSTFDRYFAMVGSTGTITGQQFQFQLQLYTEGFTVFKPGNHGTALPLLNETDRKYYYIAFR